jgi:ABC-2 type transport system ATP-binding protein
VINQGEIVADGTFEELKEREGETLEKIFTKLTGKEDSYDEAQDIINALE